MIANVVVRRLMVRVYAQKVLNDGKVNPFHDATIGYRFENSEGMVIDLYYKDVKSFLKEWGIGVITDNRNRRVHKSEQFGLVKPWLSRGESEVNPYPYVRSEDAEQMLLYFLYNCPYLFTIRDKSLLPIDLDKAL